MAAKSKRETQSEEKNDYKIKLEDSGQELEQKEESTV